MALNRKFPGQNKTLPLTKAIAQTAARTTNFALSGDPVRIGKIPGVALINADASGRTVVQTDGVFELLVQGTGPSGALAVNGGDKVVFNEGDTPPLSVKTTGTYFGKVLGDSGVEVVAAGATTTKVKVLIGGGE